MAMSFCGWLSTPAVRTNAESLVQFERCLLDVFSQSGGRFIQTAILPVRDNCAAVTGFAMTVSAIRTISGATPTKASGAGFSCTDTDPRSQLGETQLGANDTMTFYPRS